MKLGLWRNDQTIYGNIFNLWVFSVLLSSLIHLFFLQTFIPDERVMQISTHLSIGVSLVSFLAGYILYVKGHWKFNMKKWNETNRVKKILLLPFAPIFVFFLYSTFIERFVPYLITSYIGENTIVSELVEKKREVGRYNCLYQITSKKWPKSFVQICISEEFYNRLPKVPFKANLGVVKSSYGMIVENVKNYQKI